MFIPTLKIFKNLNLIKISFSTILIMTIIGLWHGPSINYIFFGFLHGLGLAIKNYLSNKNINFLPIENNKIRNVVCWILTFLL